MSGSRSHGSPRPQRTDARPVAKQNDRHEHEAEHAAEIVAGGGAVRGWSFSAVPTSAPVQRQDDGKPKSDDEKKKEAASKAAEAALATPQGKALKEKVLADPVVKTVKDAVTSTPGLIATGAVAAGGVAALGATHKPLPFQPPEIPLDKITPGLSAKVTYQGPVDRPTFVGLTITYKEQGPKAKKVSEGDKIAAETARLRADQELFKPSSQKAAEQQQEDEVVQAWIASQRLTIPLTPGPATPADAPKKEDEQKKDEEAAPVQRAPDSAAPAPARAHVDDALASSGRPLEPSTRRTMEARFGHDFAGVRVHDDAKAADTATSIDAAAFTVGDDVVFARDRYDAKSPGGMRLLAHELAHVAQQRAGTKRVQRKAEPAISAPSDPAEREADETADRVVAGLSVAGAGTSVPPTGIQRQEADDEPQADEELVWPELEEAEGPDVQASRTSGPATAPHGFTRALAGAGGGDALPATPRRELERAFGTSFSQVRLHRDASSDLLAGAIGAEAFASGSHVYLGRRAPDPATPAGLRLLAHELTHVRQQAATGSAGRILHRSRALYFSTLGDAGFFRFAARYHSDRGYPAPVRVSSVEELLENLLTLPRPIERVRLVTHAVPAGIFLPLLRGGTTSLFQRDLALQSQESLEGELATEHTTQRTRPGDDPAAFDVRETAHHVVPQAWVADAYARVRADADGQTFLQSRQFPPAVTPGGDLETLIWWTLDRELVLAQRQGPARRGRRPQLEFVLPNIPARQRNAVAVSLERNAAIYRERARDHLLLRGYPARGTPDDRRREATTAVDEFVRRLATAAVGLIDARAPGLAVAFALSNPRYESVQGALERGTFPNNLLFAKVAIPNGMPFEIRGCRIGQNGAWLEAFRDFWGLGAESTRKRPDVSAPNLFDFFGLRGRRSAEWLSARRHGGRAIHEGTAEFDGHIVHRR